MIEGQNRLGRGTREAEPPDDALTPSYDYRNEPKDWQKLGVRFNTDLMQEEDNILDVDTDYSAPQANSEDNVSKLTQQKTTHLRLNQLAYKGRPDIDNPLKGSILEWVRQQANGQMMQYLLMKRLQPWLPWLTIMYL